MAGLTTIIASVTSGLVKVYYGQIRAKDDQITYLQGMIDRLLKAQEEQTQHQSKQVVINERVASLLEKEREVKATK